MPNLCHNRTLSQVEAEFKHVELAKNATRPARVSLFTVKAMVGLKEHGGIFSWNREFWYFLSWDNEVGGEICFFGMRIQKAFPGLFLRFGECITLGCRYLLIDQVIRFSKLPRGCIVVYFPSHMETV